MKRLFSIFVCVASLAAIAQVKPLSRHELHEITERGKQLADNSLAINLAEDALRRSAPSYSRDLVPIAQKLGGHWVVMFGSLNQAHDAFLISYQANEHDNDFQIQSFIPAQVNSGYYLSAARAIDQAASVVRGHNIVFHFTAFPADEGIYVYAQLNRQKLGADFRDRYTPDGLTRVDRRVMHRALVPMTEVAFRKTLKDPDQCFFCFKDRWPAVFIDEDGGSGGGCSINMNDPNSEYVCDSGSSGYYAVPGWKPGSGDDLIQAIHDAPEDSDVAFVLLRKRPASVVTKTFTYRTKPHRKHPASVLTKSFTYWIRPDGKIRRIE